MDSIVFIIALAVAIVVISWYVANEARGADGDFGLLALKGNAAPDGESDAAETSMRYRTRARLAPEKRGGLRAIGAEKSYRAKEAARSRRGEDNVEGDKEY